MAVTNTASVPLTAPFSAGTNLATCDVTATADGDVTTGNIAHGLSFIPTIAFLIPLLPQGALKAWSWDRVNTSAVNIVFVGNNIVGSGVAGASLMAVYGRLHSIIR